MTWVILAICVFVASVLGFVVFVVRNAKAGYRDRERIRRQLRGLAEPVFDRDQMPQIRLRCMSTLSFAIRPEDALSERMRRGGNLVEIQTGDASFDRSMYLECDDARLGDWLRGDAQARAQIASLVGSTRRLVLRDGWLSLTVHDLKDAGGVLQELAQRLQELGNRVPSMAGSAPVPTTLREPRSGVVGRVAYVVLAMGLLAGSIAWGDMIQNVFPQHVTLWPMLLGSGLVGALPATVAYLVALRTMRGSSHAPRLASDLFVKIWIPLFSITVIALHQFNLRGGAGEEHVEETVVAGLESRRNLRSTSHYFLLPALDQGRIPATRYASTSSINRGLRQGQRVRVTWREGPIASYLLVAAPEPLPGPMIDKAHP